MPRSAATLGDVPEGLAASGALALSPEGGGSRRTVLRAGAKGDTSARIFAASLEAELVSIAGVYRTSDTPLPADVQGKAAQVWLAEDKLHMRAL